MRQHAVKKALGPDGPSWWCILCTRPYCKMHEGKEKHICEINHLSFYHNYRGYVHIYRDLEHKDKPLEEEKKTLEMREKVAGRIAADEGEGNTDQLNSEAEVVGDFSG